MCLPPCIPFPLLRPPPPPPLADHPVGRSGREGLKGHSVEPFDVPLPLFPPQTIVVVRRLHLRLHPTGNHRRSSRFSLRSSPSFRPSTCHIGGCRATKGGGKVDGARTGHASFHSRQNFAGYIRGCLCPSVANTGVG